MATSNNTSDEWKKGAALRRWNTGEDPQLQKLSDAEVLLSSRGFSAARSAKDGGRVRRVVDQAMQAEPDPNLPESSKQSFRKKQLQLADLYDGYMRDAAEFSGKPVGNIESVKPEWKRQEEEAEKRQADLERKAAEAKKKGDETWKNEVVSEIASDGPGRMGVTKDGQQIYQEATPSGGFVSIKGKQVTDNLLASQERDREEAQKNEEFQANLAQLRRDRAINRLTDSGYNWKSADSAELFNEDGSLNLDRAKRAADLAQGRKAQATFDSWDADRELERRAVAMEKDARSERSYLRRAQRGAFGLQAQREAQSPEGRRRIAKLENDLSAGESDPAGLNAGFWREEAEKVDAAGTERRAAVRNLQAADEAKAKSIMENSKTVEEALGQLYKQLESGEINIEQADAIQAYLRNKYGGTT